MYAVAVGQIVLGDKEDLARTAFLNEDHAVDVESYPGYGPPNLGFTDTE